MTPEVYNKLMSYVSDFGGTIEGALIESQSEVYLDSANASSKSGKRKGGDSLSGSVQRKKGANEHANLTDVIKAKINIKYAFGSSVTPFDSVLSYATAIGGDKESVDRIVYRVGKQVCVLDPENGNQQFFTGRHRSVSNVQHFSISPNQKYICMCESTRQDGKDDLVVTVTAQLSVYSLGNFTRLKTLSHPSKAEFVCASFCGDPKYITALTGEADKQIIVWHWEKEKVHKTMHISLPITRLRSAPCNNLMLTTSGLGVLKSWFLGPDGAFRPVAMLPVAKESENFIDHCWMSVMIGGLAHKMVALTDPDSASSGSYSNGTSTASALSINHDGALTGGGGGTGTGGSVVSIGASSSSTTGYVTK